MRNCICWLDDENIFNCLSPVVGFKPNQMWKFFAESKSKNQNSKLPQSTYQDIYDFWLKHSITWTNNLEKNSQK